MKINEIKTQCNFAFYNIIEKFVDTDMTVCGREVNMYTLCIKDDTCKSKWLWSLNLHACESQSSKEE